jgi:hypothetical protein
MSAFIDIQNGDHQVVTFHFCDVDVLYVSPWCRLAAMMGPALPFVVVNAGYALKPREFHDGLTLIEVYACLIAPRGLIKLGKESRYVQTSAF